MSRLSDLLGRARSWLAKPVVEPATQAVAQDRFQAAVFDSVLEEVPALRQVVDDLNVHYDYTRELVADTFAQCYQAAPRLREAGEMATSHLLNHAVATAMLDSPELAQVRPFARHQRYGATMATLGLAERLRERLAQQTELARATEQAREAKAAHEQAERDLQQQAAAGQQAQQDLAQAMGQFDGNGPLTAEQAQAVARVEAAADALAAAMSAVEQAEDGVADATEQVRELIGAQAGPVQAEVNEALAAAAQDLAAEDEVLAAWGLEPGEVSAMSVPERQALARRLRTHRLSKWAAQLGRWRLMAAAQRAKKVTRGRDEVYDTELSDRLPDVLAGEFALLGSRIGRVDFMVRLTERALVSKRYRGIERVGKGAVICLVDTSDSMNKTDRHGVSRECWAKGLALALLEQARAERRDFVGIIFSSRTQQQVFRFPTGRCTLDETLTFAAAAFNGGTHYERPLDLAVEVLRAEFNSQGRAKGDVVVITDDECAVSADWLTRYQADKADLGFRTWGVAIGLPGPGSTLRALSDDVRTVQEFIDPSQVADLVRAV